MVFTGGGTGGHVYPGLAVLESLRIQRDVLVTWIGGTGMEREIVRSHNVPFRAIPTGKLRRYLSLRNLTDLFRVLAGIVAAARILRELRPAVVFSKGGFVSVPAVIAARLRRVPVVSHESDADPGLATRINTRSSARLLVAYEATRDHFPVSVRERVRVTGNPIRAELFLGDRTRGEEIAGFDAADSRPVMLVLGGSQGSRQLNELLLELRSDLEQQWRIVHQCGTGAAPAASTRSYFARQYFSGELPDLLARADLVLCRAGAGTLWECASLGIPLVMVPLVAGSRGDQVRNAGIFHAAGAGLLVDAPDTGTRSRAALREAIGHFEDGATRARAGAAASRFAPRDAARLIATEILAHAGKPSGREAAHGD